MLDRGFRNDIKVLQIICLFCEWNGSFEEYEVKQSYFMKVFIVIIRVPFSSNILVVEE